jgi:uncharacterized protein YjdB
MALKRLAARVVTPLLVTIGIVASALASAQPSAIPELSYGAHVQDVGWQADVSGGATAGTTAQAKAIEALRFVFAGQQAHAHVQDLGWQGWRRGASTIGTTGLAKHLEAIEVMSTTRGVSIRCQAHVQDVGWMPVVGDGELCGTTGRGLRIESLRLWAVSSPGSDPVPAPSDAALSTVATAGDFNTGAQSEEVFRQMGEADPDLVFLLGDISQSATQAQPVCDLVKTYIDDPFGWVQGNHDVPPDSDGPVTADYLKCLPRTPKSTGIPAVEQVIRIPGARIITASPHLAGSNYDRGSAGLARVGAAIDAAQAAGDFAIIAIHRPHYTVGMHGTSGTESKAISELAIAKGVKLVLNGHDHNYSRIETGGTTFVTAGTGGHGPRALDPTSNRWPITVKAYGGTPGAYGWLKLSITKNSIIGDFIGTHGDDTFTLDR